MKTQKPINPEDLFAMAVGLNRLIAKEYESCVLCEKPTPFIFDGSRMCLECSGSLENAVKEGSKNASK